MRYNCEHHMIADVSLVTSIAQLELTLLYENESNGGRGQPVSPLCCILGAGKLLMVWWKYGVCLWLRVITFDGLQSTVGAFLHWA